MEVSRQEYWSGLPFPSPGDLPDPGIEPRFPAMQADPLLTEPEKWHCRKAWLGPHLPLSRGLKYSAPQLQFLYL